MTNLTDFGVFAHITLKTFATTPRWQHLPNGSVCRGLVETSMAWLWSSSRYDGGERCVSPEMDSLPNMDG